MDVAVVGERIRGEIQSGASKYAIDRETEGAGRDRDKGFASDSVKKR